MQGNIVYISLPPFPYCCHRLSGFWGAQESFWGHGFSSETQNLSSLWSYIPSPSASPLLKGCILPSSFLSKLHMPEVLLNFVQAVMLYGFQGSYRHMVFLNHLSGTFLLWTPDCSQATLECISHKPQAFVVLLFQSISQTTSLVRRCTPLQNCCE